jgi:2-polyprenyl-6-methoxyphenol hydroxylase-like FAD-dependent oxidoreductase
VRVTKAITPQGTAIIIGASIAGVLAAQVLSLRFSKVILIDKDALPDDPATRNNVPQEHHVHLLLHRGRQNMERMFPGFLAALEADGAQVVDLSHGVKWHLAGRWKNRWPTGITAHYCSRTLVEHHLRRRALMLPGVELRQRTIVQEPMWDAGGNRIIGVKITRPDGGEEQLAADFVLDASGRGSSAPAWLRAQGFEEPEAEHIVARLGYASRIYQRDPKWAGKWDVLLVTPRLPEDRRMGVISPIENDRWMVTAGGWLGQFPQADEDSFLSFMRDLPVPDIHDVISGATPLTDVRRFALSGGLRRRYDRLARFPQGFFVIGDAVCSSNPIYSQGMSISSMQTMAFADRIDDFLAGRISPITLFADTVGATSRSWDQARAGDERFDEVRAPDVTRNRWRDAYFDELVQASHEDRSITLALMRNSNLMDDAPNLTAPDMVLRTLLHSARRRLSTLVS